MSARAFGIVAVVLAATSMASAAAAPTVTLTSVKITAHWSESWLTGSVSFSGTVSGESQLEAVLRPVSRSGPPAAAVEFATTGAASFSKTLKLPNRLLPGTYRLTIDSVAGPKITPVSRDVVNPRPPEGIVDRAWASASRNGPPISTVKAPRSQLWAYFHFAVPPTSPNVTGGWHSPSFRWYGKATKHWTTTFESHLGTTGGLALERGVWFVYLFSGKTVIKRARVRIS